MKVLLRVIAGSLALGALVQGQTLLTDLGDWPEFIRWAGPVAAWFVLSELVHIIGGTAGAIQLWSLKPMGRVIAIVVSVADCLHSFVPWLIGPALGINHFRLRGPDLFGMVIGGAVLVVLLHPSAVTLCRNSPSK